MANKQDTNQTSETERLVMDIMDDKNISASKKLEKILRRKAAKRISEVLDA